MSESLKVFMQKTLWDEDQKRTHICDETFTNKGVVEIRKEVGKRWPMLTSCFCSASVLL